MSERANELPDGWRRDGDGVAFGPGGFEILPVLHRRIDGTTRDLFSVKNGDGSLVPRPYLFPTEAEAIARAVELTRPSDPAPDHRDAEIERLRTQVGEQSREIAGLKAELAARPAEAMKALERQEWIEGMKADVDYVPSVGWRLYARGLGGWTTSGHGTPAAAIDAAMARHPLTREGE